MDSLLEAAGPFGFYQKLNILLIGLVGMITALGLYSSIFFTAEPALNCYAKNFSVKGIGSLQGNELTTCQMWKNYTLSRELDLSSPYHCEFKDDYYNLTIVNDWELVCDKQYLNGLSQTIFLIGTVCAAINGIISDKLGRKRACSIFLIIHIVLSVIYQVLISDIFFLALTSWHKFIVYTVYQFLTALIQYCMYTIIFVMIIEFTNDEYHILSGSCAYYSYVFGELFVLVTFYISRDWRVTNISNIVFIIVASIIFISFVDESPRWLVKVKRYEDAFRVLKKIAKFNKVKNFETDFNEDMSIKLMESYQIKESGCCEDDQKGLFKKMLGSKHKLFKFIGLIFVWNALCLNYVGISIGITTVLDVNPFLIYLLSSLFEALGIFTCRINEKIGCKTALIIYFLILSTSSLLVSALPDDPDTSSFKIFLYFKAVLALTGRWMVAAAFNTAFIYTSELYDVEIRNTAVLLAYTGGAVSSFVTPQINSLKYLVWKPLPYIIYSSTGYLSCFVVFFLPKAIQFEYVKN